MQSPQESDVTAPIEAPRVPRVYTGSAGPMPCAPLSPLTPVLVFLLGLGLAVSAALWKKSEIDSNAQALFKHSVNDVVDHVQSRLTRPLQGLQGAKGLYAASQQVDRAKFQAYVESHDMAREFAGVRGFAFVQRVLRPDLPAFLSAERADGAPRFALRQLADKTHADYYVVKLIAPAAGSSGAQGLDIGSEPIRREAAQRAMDTGLPTITSVVTLVQDQLQTPGVLLFLPVYAIGAHPSTPAERRASLRGLLNVPLVMSELLTGMAAAREGYVDFELFDSPVMPTGQQVSALLFDSDNHTASLSPLEAADHGAVPGRRYSNTQIFNFAGRDMVLRVNSTAGFDARVDHTAPWLLFFGGALLSALLALLLRKSEASASALLDELQLQKYAMDQHSIVVATDVQGRITHVNDKFCDISGYCREELIGQDHAMFNSGTHPHGFFKAMYRTLATGAIWRNEVCNKAKNGHLYWVETTIVPVMDSAGKPERYLSVRADITLRKQVELDLIQQQLHLERRVQQKTKEAVQSEQHLRLVMNTSLDAIIGMDVQGRITEWSRQAEVSFGWTFAEVIGQYLHDFIIPLRHREAHQRGLAHYLASGVGPALGKRIEISALRRDGTEFPIELAISPIVTPQGTTFSAYISDLTQHKQEQAALVAAKTQAEGASRAKSDFLANMSHEIRTPMNGVIGMVDVLQQTDLLPAQQRMLDTIHTSSLALLQILNDILDFSKIEAGKLEVESVAVHLRDVAEGVAQLMVSLPGTHAEVSLFVSTALPGLVMGDPNRLRQVLLNLLGNAIKFSNKSDGHRAEVRLTVSPCRLENGENYVRFAVADNGIGMSPEVVAKLFQPFTQADESTARKFGGSGLGLSISQRLAEMMGGRISVRSTLGEGSEFTVELPLRAVPGDLAVPDEPNLAGVQVLLVSANAFDRSVRTAYCQHAGAHITAVANMAMAHEILAQSPPAQTWVVLLDRTVTQPTIELGLPTAVSVVREASRDGPAYPNDIVLPVRPMLYRDLIRAIAHASGRLTTGAAASSVERRANKRPIAPTLEVAVQTGRLVLLAEDNETNREVMQEQLRLLGYTCEVAEDGAIALNMWQTNPGRYALLLSDCHMPRLDGFGLTQAIRTTEAAGARLPIIAVTANAMQGEAQRCLERGMDDYLSKPLRMTELCDKLEKWLPVSKPTGPALTEPVAGLYGSADGTTFPIWSPATLNELVGDNPAMHKRLLERFLSHAERQVAEISAAVAANDPLTVGGVAHTLKSAARSVGALRLGELCQSLEVAAIGASVPHCRALAAELPESLAVAVVEINGHLGR